MEHKKVRDGQWFRPRMRRHYIECCDCGLVHTFDYKVTDLVNGHMIMIRAVRNRKATAAARKGKPGRSYP